MIVAIRLRQGLSFLGYDGLRGWSCEEATPGFIVR